MMGVATRDGIDDERKTGRDKQTDQGVSRSRKEKEVRDSRYVGADGFLCPEQVAFFTGIRTCITGVKST